MSFFETQCCLSVCVSVCSNFWAPWPTNFIFTRTWLRYGRVFAIANPPVVCLSSATFVRPTQAVETVGNISSPFCTLAILWPPCKILRRSSQGNPSVGGVKRKRGIKMQRCYVRVSHLLMSLLLVSRCAFSTCRSSVNVVRSRSRSNVHTFATGLLQLKGILTRNDIPVTKSNFNPFTADPVKSLQFAMLV